MERVTEIKEYALNQLKAEYEYYKEKYSINAAERLRTGFFDYIEFIELNADSYPVCRFIPTKSRKYRNAVWGNYLIVFAISKTKLTILSLFHTKQHPNKLKTIKRIK
jgi:plasmid stabilization system protein ParE